MPVILRLRRFRAWLDLTDACIFHTGHSEISTTDPIPACFQKEWNPDIQRLELQLSGSRHIIMFIIGFL